MRPALLLSLLFIALPAFAGNQATVPTAVQVVDANGNTQYFPRQRMLEVPPVPWTASTTCLELNPSKEQKINTERNSLLSTRMSVDIQTLERTAKELSFDPYIPKSLVDQTMQVLIQSAQGVLEASTSEKTFHTMQQAVNCMTTYNDVFVQKSKNVRNSLPLSHIEVLVQALEYGAFIEQQSSLPPRLPMDIAQAAYFADVLKSQDDRIQSLSLTENSATIVYGSTAHRFGLDMAFQFTVALDSNGVHIASPWWLFATNNVVTNVRTYIEAHPLSGGTGTISNRASATWKLVKGVETIR